MSTAAVEQPTHVWKQAIYPLSRHREVLRRWEDPATHSSHVEVRLFTGERDPPHIDIELSRHAPERIHEHVSERQAILAIGPSTQRRLGKELALSSVILANNSLARVGLTGGDKSSDFVARGSEKRPSSARFVPVDGRPQKRARSDGSDGSGKPLPATLARRPVDKFRRVIAGERSINGSVYKRVRLYSVDAPDDAEDYVDVEVEVHEPHTKVRPLDPERFAIANQDNNEDDGSVRRVLIKEISDNGVFREYFLSEKVDPPPQGVASVSEPAVTRKEVSDSGYVSSEEKSGDEVESAAGDGPLAGIFKLLHETDALSIGAGKIIPVQPNMLVAEAAAVMLEKSFTRLPVRSSTGVFHGWADITDFIIHLVDAIGTTKLLTTGAGESIESLFQKKMPRATLGEMLRCPFASRSTFHPAPAHETTLYDAALAMERGAHCVPFFNQTTGDIVGVLGRAAVVQFLAWNSTELESLSANVIDNLPIDVTQGHISVNGNQAVIEAVRAMAASNATAVAVVSPGSNELIGNFSARDIWRLPDASYLAKPVSLSMKAPPHYVTLHDTLQTAIQLCAEKNIHQVWVTVPGSRGLVGRLSITDVLSAVLGSHYV